MNGLDQKKFYNTIEKLKYSNTVIENYVDENIKRNTFFLKIENKLILNKDFFLQPKEVVFRALTNLIKKIGNKYYPVRGKKLVKIIEDLENNVEFKATLGGCIIERINQTVIITKEH